MGTLFYLFSHISAYLTILALALALASGIYILSTLAEEFPTATAKLLKYTIATNCLIQILLWMDGLPTNESIIQLFSFLAYASMMGNFPFFDLLSLSTLCALLGFCITNIMWLRYFLKLNEDPLSVLGFFVVIVWAVPCLLVASLTVNEYALPSNNTTLHTDASEGKRKSTFRVMYDYLAEKLDAMTAGLLGTVKLMREKRTS
jgi:hypothetical protein